MLVVPTVCAAKVRLPGLTDGGITPVPVRLTAELWFVLSVIVRVAFRTPTTDGVKKTEIVHLDPGASDDGLIGQVVVVV